VWQTRRSEPAHGPADEPASACLRSRWRKDGAMPYHHGRHRKEGSIMRYRHLAARLAALVLLLTTAACASTYYRALEQLGVEKRDLLVKRVAAAQGSQKEAQQEFRSALEQFQSVVDFEGGELQARYEALSEAFEDSRSQAADVRKRIDSVESVAGALFEEWEDELDRYQDDALRERSAEQLSETQRRYDGLIEAMNAAAERMDPVLELFEDQVLFLKHNLNAKAIGSLEDERSTIEERVAVLIDAMESSIREAERFIKEMS
jgi:Skp family chaperone for outer membrane proteins